MTHIFHGSVETQDKSLGTAGAVTHLPMINNRCQLFDNVTRLIDLSHFQEGIYISPLKIAILSPRIFSIYYNQNVTVSFPIFRAAILEKTQAAKRPTLCSADRIFFLTFLTSLW